MAAYIKIGESLWVLDAKHTAAGVVHQFQTARHNNQGVLTFKTTTGTSLVVSLEGLEALEVGESGGSRVLA